MAKLPAPYTAASSSSVLYSIERGTSAAARRPLATSQPLWRITRQYSASAVCQCKCHCVCHRPPPPPPPQQREHPRYYYYYRRSVFFSGAPRASTLNRVDQLVTSGRSTRNATLLRDLHFILVAQLVKIRVCPGSPPALGRTLKYSKPRPTLGRTSLPSRAGK